MSEPAAPLAPAAFFELAGFRHQALFAGASYVWEALGRIESYLRELGATSIEGKVSTGAWLEGDLIVIGEGSVVEPGAYIQGPCFIGRNTEVRHGAYLRGNVVVGDGCVVGHATEVKNSVFLDGAKAGHFAYVGDSLLGRGVNLGAGTKLANLRLDGARVTVRIGENEIDTGRRKLGAVLGDGTETGCNSVTNPGTFLGRGCRVLPCVNIGGHAPDGSVLGRRARA